VRFSALQGTAPEGARRRVGKHAILAELRAMEYAGQRRPLQSTECVVRMDLP
jgi:hypothetical protein